MMNADVKVTFNTQRFLQALPRAIDTGLTAAVERGSRDIVRVFGRQHGGIPSRAGMPPNSQTGALRRSIAYTPGRGGLATIYSNLPYARFLERGGTIRPKTRRMLAFPVSNEGKSLVRNYGSPGAAIARAKAMKNRGRLVYLRSVKGYLVGWKKGETFTRLFVLARSVTVQARPWAKPGLAVAMPGMRAAFTRAASREMRGAAQAGGAA